MKYFCTEEERKGTCYHEFQQGKWDGKTFWKEDSLLMEDDVCWNLGFGKLLKETLPDYDPYANIEVTQVQWDEICQKVAALGGELAEAVGEADTWVHENFLTHEAFTILGL